MKLNMPNTMFYKLTGRTRFRMGFRKRLILQVEYKEYEPHETWRVDWRDAKITDIAIES